MGRHLKSVKKFIFALMILMFFLLLHYNNSYAENEITYQIVKGQLDESKFAPNYRKWLELPEVQKQEVIQPSLYSTPYYEPQGIQSYNLESSTANKYDLRDYINISVKDQLRTQSCWTFPLISEVETNISLTRGYNSPIFSTRHMEYATAKTFLDGINQNGYNREVGSGGNSYLGLSYMVSGRGPVLEKDMPFENSEEMVNLSEIDKEVGQKIEDYVRFPSIFKEINSGTTTYNDGNGNTLTETQVQNIRKQIKEHIVKYGGVSGNTNSSQTQFFNNPSPILATAYYCDDPDVVEDHIVTIVGWDDNYSKENFSGNHRPSKDGAWLVLNSYGAGFNGGYYYISYEDVLLERETTGIRTVVDKDYKNIYQYDILGANMGAPMLINSSNGETTPAKEMYAANVFSKKDDTEEYLKEIAITGKGTNTIDVYIDTTGGLNINNATLIQSGIILNDEYKTIKLEEPVKLTNDKFSVIIKYTSDEQVKIAAEVNIKENGGEGENKWDTATAQDGEGFVSITGADGAWQDFTDIYEQSSLCIKAFTTTDDTTGPTIEFETNGNNTYKKEQGTKVTVTDASGVNRSSLRYVWTQSTNQPLISDFENWFENDTVVSNNTETGNNWYLWIMAKDNLGNISYKCSNAFYLDNTPPTAPTITSNVTHNVYTKENADITINGSNALSGIAKYQYSLNDEENWTDVTTTISITKSGIYRIKARAISNTGVIGQESEQYIIKIDKEPPKVEGIIEGGLYKNITPIITDETEITAILTKNEVESSYNIDADNKGEEINQTGIYKLTVSDELGNTTILNFEIDSTPPIVQFEPNGNTTYQKEQSTVVTVNDRNIDESSLRYIWLQDVEEVTENIFTDEASTSFTSGDRISKGDRTGDDFMLCIIAKDVLGNTTLIKSDAFYLDNSIPNPPNIRSNIGSGNTTNEDVKITINGSSSPSGIKKYQYSMNNGQTWTDVQVGEEIVLTETNTYNIIARAISNLDIIGQNSQEYTVTINKDVPKIIFNPNGSSIYKKEQSTKITIEHSGTLEQQSFKYLWSQNTEVPSEDEFTEEFYIDGTISKNTGSGIWYLWATAKDILGNTVIARSEGFYLDNDTPTKPTIKSNAQNNQYIGEDAIITLSGSTSTSGIKKYKYSINNQLTWTDVAENEEFRLQEDGIYEVYAAAVNNVGKTGEISGPYIIKIDKTAPIIKGIEEGETYKEITPVIEDSTNITITLVKDGETIPYDPGDTITETGDYKITVKDELNNESTINFKIDSTPPVITFTPNGNTTYQKEQSTTISITDANELDESSIRYKWTQSVQVLTEETFMPDSIPFSNGDTITKDKVSGDNWYLWILAKDKLGNMSLVKSTSFYLDNGVPEAPTITASVESDVFTSEDVSLKISGSTALSGIAKYQYSLDSGKTWVDVGINETITIQESGTYNIIARAVSNVGIAGKTGQTYIIKINKGEPVITFEPDGNSNYAKSQTAKIKVDYKGELAQDGLKYLWTTQEEGIQEENFETSFTNNQSITKNTESGTWYLWAMAKDSLGNKIIKRSNAYYLDNEVPEAPTVKLNAQNDSVINKSLQIEISGSNSPSGIAKYQYSLNGGQTWIDSKVGEIVKVEKSGSYQIKARAVNNVGTIGNETQEEYNITISKEDITIAFVPNEEKAYKKEQSTQVIVGSNITLDESNMKYLWSTKAEGIEETDFVETFKNKQTIIKNTESGTWYLWVLAKDTVGNQIIARSGEFNLDNEVPEAPIITKNEIIEEDKVELMISGSSSLSGIAKYQYSLNNGKTWTDLQVGEKVILDNIGTYEVKARAINNVGTTGESTDLHIVEVQTRIPSISYTPNGNTKYEKEQSSRIQVRSSLDLDKSSLKYIWTTTQEGITEKDFEGKASFGNGETVIKDSGDGIWYLFAMAKNIQGDTKIQRSEAFYIDNTAPIIEGVKDGETYENVQPIIKDNSSIKIEVMKDGYAFEYKQGDIIEEEGVYQISVTDEADNRTDVTFTIKQKPIDTTGPMIHFEPNGNMKYEKEQSTLVNVEDESGVNNESLRYLWSRSTQMPSEEEFINQFNNASTITNNKDTGKLYLWIYAEDIAGNVSILRSNEFYLDNTKPLKPEISTNVEDNGTTSGDVVIEVSGGEKESEVEYEYSTDGGETWEKVVDDKIIITEEGSYDIIIRSENEVGEYSDENTNISFTIDKTPQQPQEPDEPEIPEEPETPQEPQNPDNNNTNNQGKDDTVAKDPIPQAGWQNRILIAIVVTIIIMIITAIRARKLEK